MSRGRFIYVSRLILKFNVKNSKKLVQTNGAPSKKLVSENRLTRPLSNKLLSQDVEYLASWGSFAFRFFFFVFFLFSFCVLATFGLRVSGTLWEPIWTKKLDDPVFGCILSKKLELEYILTSFFD